MPRTPVKTFFRGPASSASGKSPMAPAAFLLVAMCALIAESKKGMRRVSQMRLVSVKAESQSEIAVGADIVFQFALTLTPTNRRSDRSASIMIQ